MALIDAIDDYIINIFIYSQLAMELKDRKVSNFIEIPMHPVRYDLLAHFPRGG